MLSGQEAVAIQEMMTTIHAHTEMGLWATRWTRGRGSVCPFPEPFIKYVQVDCECGTWLDVINKKQN